jgi:hypothetical protein
MDVELFLANNRRIAERGRLTKPLNDEYGLERIDAMETEIRAEYAVKMADEESEDAMKDDSTAGDMEMIERLRPEDG